MPKKSKKSLPDDFNKAVRDVAEALLRDAVTHTPENGWASAYLDVRGSANGRSRLSKFRINLSDGSILATLDDPNETTQLLYKIWKLKDKAFPDKWYGLLITVHPDDKCHAEFNYDPECSSDPTFFDD